MSDQFFEQPILNSPYDYPGRHWELDESGQPTQNIQDSRREAKFISPIPKPRRRGGEQRDLGLENEDISTKEQAYQHTAVINAIRKEVDAWRKLPKENWLVYPETEVVPPVRTGSRDF